MVVKILVKTGLGFCIGDHIASTLLSGCVALGHIGVSPLGGCKVQINSTLISAEDMAVPALISRICRWSGCASSTIWFGDIQVPCCSVKFMQCTICRVGGTCINCVIVNARIASADVPLKEFRWPLPKAEYWSIAKCPKCLF